MDAGAQEWLTHTATAVCTATVVFFSRYLRFRLAGREADRLDFSTLLEAYRVEIAELRERLAVVERRNDVLEKEHSDLRIEHAMQNRDHRQCEDTVEAMRREIAEMRKDMGRGPDRFIPVIA